MNDDLSQQIYNSLNQKETDELIAIWQKHDLDQWTRLAFDVIQEILQSRQVELPSPAEPGSPPAEIDENVDIGEVDQKIKEKETLLLQAKNKSTMGWITVILSLVFIIPLLIKYSTVGIFWIFFIFGLFYLGLNFWRVYSASQQIKDLESELEKYRLRKAKFQAASHVKE